MQRLLILVVVSLMVLFFATLAFAPNGGIPHLINYQGMLTNDVGEPLTDEDFDLTFRIYNDSTDGTLKWAETQYGISVTNGLFNVNLGDSTAIDLAFDEDYWLEIEVGVHGSLSPRIRLTSVPYAYRAEWVDTSDYSFQALRADTADYATVAVAAESDSDWTISGNNIYSTVSGNVGIGITSPAAKLHVYEGVLIRGPNAGIYIAPETNSGSLGYNDGSSAFSNIRLYDGKTSFNGNVGIGTTSPTAPLTIQPILGPDIEFGGGSWNADIMADRQFNVGTLNASTFSLMTDNQYRLLIQGGGNVGIGTTSPAAKLEVYYDNTNSNFAAISIDNGTGAPRQDVLDFKFGGVTEARIRKATNGELYIGTVDNKGIRLQTNATNRMAITYAGDVGIGTISPGYKLEIVGSPDVFKAGSGNAWITMRTMGNSTINFGDGDDDKRAGFISGDENTSGDNVLKIAACDDAGNCPKYTYFHESGNVGIGISDPAYTLDVNGDINVSGNIRKGGTAYTHPDYVFEPDYELMSLDDLKTYVFEKKCLPNVISADDVKKNQGFNMDELLIQMLEKIEEQTLYIFQLEERIAELEKRQR